MQRSDDVPSPTTVALQHGHPITSSASSDTLPQVHNSVEMPPPPLTSAVTRSWSDMNTFKMLSTFAATSFLYSFFGQPLFLAIARQQCCTTHISATKVLRDVVRDHGYRGLYRGAGAAVSGTVLSELVYYFVVEFSKEKLPLPEREWRSFGAGLLADLVATPVFNPFAVVSQVQMVAGSAFGGGHNYMSAWRTTVTLLRERGMRSLFRGTVLTLVVAPLTGAWWYIYESFKRIAYRMAPLMGEFGVRRLSPTFRASLPSYITSTTDNALINSGVGAAASMVLGVIMNPIYVLRLRLQLGKPIPGVRFPLLHVVRETVHNEGVRALWKGLGGNLVAGVVGGSAFGVTYEGAKQFSDITAPVALSSDVSGG